MITLRYYQDNRIARGMRFSDDWPAQDAAFARRLLTALKNEKRLPNNVPPKFARKILKRLEDEWYIWKREGKLQPTRGAVRQCYDGWAAGHKRVLLASPTGMGKTEMALKIALDAVKNGWIVWFVVDQQNLIGQTSNRGRKYDLDVGLVWAQERKRPGAQFQVASLQTLQAQDRAAQKRGVIADWRQFKGRRNSLWILDEAHGATAWSKLGRDLVDNPGDSWFLLLTGSPFRLSASEDMGDIADYLAQTPAYRQAVDITVPELVAAYHKHGYPVKHVGGILPIRYLSADVSSQISTDGVTKTGGDWSLDELTANATNPEVLRAQYDEWSRHNFQRTLAFCCTVEHAEVAAKYWASRGVQVGVVSGEKKKTYIMERGQKVTTPRETVCEMLAKGLLRIVFSISAMIKGVDIAEIDSGLCLRPTESFAILVQMTGRIRRPCPYLGKLIATWLDMTTNFTTSGHPLPESITEFKLEVGKGKGARNPKKVQQNKRCPKCGEIVPRTALDCIGVLLTGDPCGYSWRPIEASTDFTGVQLETRELTVDGMQTEKERTSFRSMQALSYHGSAYGRFKGGKKSPGMAGSMWATKHDGKWPPNEWYLGAVFGDKYTSFHVKMYRIFLDATVRKRPPEQRKKFKDDRWVNFWMLREFGQNWDTKGDTK